MSQAGIIKVLKKARRPLTAREIAKKLNIRESSMGKSLRRLLQYGEVEIAGTVNKGMRAKYVKTYRLKVKQNEAQLPEMRG